MKTILHCDLNNFFATVECHDNPVLFKYPMAVCGDISERRGIVLAKNELAKKFFVKTAEPIHSALLKCPGLIVIKPNYDKYLAYSNRVKEIYYRFTDIIEPFGIDECWLDVSGSNLLFGDGYHIAQRIRRAVKNELGLTISVGVSYTKVYAKLANDLSEHNSVSVISPANAHTIINKLPANALTGVGRHIARSLNSSGIFTIGDIRNAGKAKLRNLFGKNGEILWNNASGIETAGVIPEPLIPPEKSIGHMETTRYDMTEPTQVYRQFVRMSDLICIRMREANKFCSQIHITIRRSDMQFLSFQKRVRPTRDPMLLSKIGIELFKLNYDWKLPLRSVGISATSLIDDSTPIFFSFDDDINRFEKLEKLYKSIDFIYNRHGTQSLVRAFTLSYDICGNPIRKLRGFAASNIK